jgi:hypothetical protein
MLNWIYADRDTYELRYGNRTASIQHIVGEWDWTADESCVMLDGWEGFVTVDESSGMSEEEWEQTEFGREGLRWAIYFDYEDNGLKGKRGKRNMFEIVLHRHLQSEEDQVKSQGGLKSQFTAPAAEKKRESGKK